MNRADVNLSIGTDTAGTEPWTSEQRERARQRAFRRWQEDRRKDRKWIPLPLLVDLYGRVLHGKLTQEDAEREGWDRIYNSIAADEFALSGASRVVMVFPRARIMQQVTPARLLAFLNTRYDRQQDLHAATPPLIDGYLKYCWVPSQLAARWLGTYGIQLPDYAVAPVRNAKLNAVRPLATAPVVDAPLYRTGTQGRPGSVHLIARELERRRVANETLNTQVAEAKALAAWLLQAHPEAPPTGAKAIRTSLTTKGPLRAAVADAKARKERPK